jgi:hypothetical protein
MKLSKLFLICFFHFYTVLLVGQMPDLQLNLRFNFVLQRYEVFALPDATQTSFFWGPSQISIVTPSSVPDEAFNITFLAGGAWTDNSRVYAPQVDPAHDYHGIGSLGAPTILVGNVEKLLFFFTLSGGGCVAGLRLFVNGFDPNSSAPGMGGGDFSNTIFAIVPGAPEGYEAYVGNYNNGGTSCSALPLDLLSLFAITQDNIVQLKWHTTSESNINHFEIQRSEKGFDFSSIFKVTSLNKEDSKYLVSDNTVAGNGYYYYRLKIVERDSSVSYSPVVVASVGDIPDVSVFPNPVINAMQVEFYSPSEQDMPFQVTDISGKLIKAGSLNCIQGNNKFNVDFADSLNGVYFLKVFIDARFQTVKKIIKHK